MAHLKEDGNSEEPGRGREGAQGRGLCHSGSAALLRYAAGTNNPQISVAQEFISCSSHYITDMGCQRTALYSCSGTQASDCSVIPQLCHLDGTWGLFIFCSWRRTIGRHGLFTVSASQRLAISSHISLARTNHMAPPNCRGCWEVQSFICPERKEHQILVSISNVHQKDLGSGLQDERAERDRQLGVCAEIPGEVHHSLPLLKGQRELWECQQVWTKFLAILGYPENVSF